MYTKLVVIVNGKVSVDKIGLLHSIKRLRHRLPAEQSLRPACTELGQKTNVPSKRSFCTSDPVDIQELFHSWDVGHASTALMSLCRQLVVDQDGSRACEQFDRASLCSTLVHETLLFLQTVFG